MRMILILISIPNFYMNQMNIFKKKKNTEKYQFFDKKLLLLFVQKLFYVFCQTAGT